MIDFLKNWKTTIVAGLAIMMGTVAKLVPDFAPIIHDLELFLIGVIAFFAKDADKTGVSE